MEKGGLDIDPRGLIFDSFRMDGIGPEDCRAIFLDWALGVPDGEDMAAHINRLVAHYGGWHPDHPMTGILRQGLGTAAEPAKRRSRRRPR